MQAWVEEDLEGEADEADDGGGEADFGCWEAKAPSKMEKILGLRWWGGRARGGKEDED